MMHNVFRSAGRRLLLLPLALAVFAGCQDRELPTGIASALSGAAFSQVPGNPVVNSLLDDGTGCTDAKCTLRDAIAYASAGGTITFDPALTAGGSAVIILTQGELFIQQDLTVTGPGATSLSVSGNNESRVLLIGPSSNVSISGLTVTQGRAVFPRLGGGISNSGVLVLTDATVSGNAGEFGSGINNAGTLTIASSTVSGNSVVGTSAGSGIHNDSHLIISHSAISDNPAGAGITNGGWSNIANSTISGNSSYGIQTGGSLILTKSTVSNNNGGGINSAASNLTITSSTISGNQGVGIVHINLDDGLIITSSTVSVNTGAALVFEGGDPSVRNSILGSCDPGRVASIVDGGYNIDEGTSCGFNAVTSMSSTDPKLGPLADNGGPTKTLALLAGSPAIDAGTCTDHLGAIMPSDQRGVSRPQPVGGACDIGAFEAPPPPPACEGVQIRMTRTAGPVAIAPGASGAWTVELEVSACEAVTQVSAQGGTVSWATTTAATSDGTIGVRKANKNNQVLLWEIGSMAAGDVATALLTVDGTVGKKVACGTQLSIVSEWSANATTGAAAVQYDAAGPLTVEVCEPPPPTPAAPSAQDDEYSLAAGEALTVLAASGLFANDALGSPAATITAVLGADGEPLGDRTILEGAVAVDPATGAFTLTGATRAGTESFQYDVTNTEGTSRAAVTITVNPGAAALMLAYAGDGQFAAPGATLLVAPAVRVTDAWDNVIAAASVAFAVSGGGGSVTGGLATTTSEGIAAVGSWTLGAEPGVNTLQATSTGLASEIFKATAVTDCTGGTPATAVFSAFSDPVRNTLELTDTRNVTLLVTDACGAPVPDVAVTWAATGNPFSSGDGITGGLMTGADGKATASWTYHYTCGTRTVSATVGELPAVQHPLSFGSCGGGGTPIRR